jgi:hypothetical protein
MMQSEGHSLKANQQAGHPADWWAKGLPAYDLRL